MKVALVYKIANEVRWGTDISENFTIGILSENTALINKFVELSKIAEINGKKIKISTFPNIKSIQPTHLLYVDQSYNSLFSSIFKKIGRQKTLLISEEYHQSGEIMINLKLEKQKNQLTFEYNRANILFQGLDLNEQIVVLKGSEIEIRELYLRAKDLWDNRKAEVESLMVQSAIQNEKLNKQKDSIFMMKQNILGNRKTIEEQTVLILKKDSISSLLNNEIKKQQNEISDNRNQINLFIKNRFSYEAIILNHRATISSQKRLSDSLSIEITDKKKELNERIKALNEKESVIKKQFYGLIVSFLIIIIVVISIFIIFRSYLLIKRAKHKIAEQKEELEVALEQLKNTQQQLIQSEKMASLGVLVAGIAHEINNPVNFISSGIDGVESVLEKATQLLSEINKISQNQQYDVANLLSFKEKLQIEDTLEITPKIIENIKIGIKRTIDITNGLRLYSHIDKEEKIHFNINHIVESAILLTKPLVNNYIEINTILEELPIISVLPGKLSQVFVNLISNAIDSINEVLENEQSKEKHFITILTKALNGKIIIEFSDSGTGIKEEIIAKLFDPFFTTKKVGKGTGLGLSITLGIIEEHKGKIYARNNLIKGATFVIEIPIVE
jgi:signal transduction histidine kinase